MQGIKRGARVIILGFLAFPGVVNLSESTSAEKKGPILCWEHSGLDVSGQPEDLDHAEIALSSPGINLNAGGSFVGLLKAPTAKGSNQAELAPLLAGRQPGKYLVWARALDKSGNASTWAGPVELVVGAGAAPAPAAPGVPGAAQPTPPESSPGTKSQPAAGTKSRPASGAEPRKEPWKRHQPNDGNGGCRAI